MEEERNQRSDTKTDDNFESPSWLKSLSAYLAKLSKKSQRTFDRLLFAFDEEQKEKIKNFLYYTICFVGFLGYVFFEFILLMIWLIFFKIPSWIDFMLSIFGSNYIDFIRQNLWAKSDKLPDFIKSPDSYQRLEPWTEEDLHRLSIHHILRPNFEDSLYEETN